MSAPRHSGRSLYKSGVRGGTQAEQDTYAYTPTMAKKIVQLTEYMDDLDGSVVEESEIDTISFSYRGTDYEIDLKSSNSTKFDTAMKKYIDSARKVGRTRSGGGSKRASSSSGYNSETLAQIREWAGQNGYEVAPRGRIKQEIISEWEAKH